MNRRMQRERGRAKFEAARQRAAVRTMAKWQKLNTEWRVRGMDDEMARVKAAAGNLVSVFQGIGRVLIVGAGGGVRVPIGTASLSFSLGPLARFARPPSCAEADQVREREFIDAGMATGSSPADPWPCGDCMVETRQEPYGLYWRTVERTRPCDMCRAQGAPEYLP